MKTNPFDHRRFIGYLSKVKPDFSQIHFPNSQLLKKFYYDGDVLHGGIVRNYVIIEGEGYGFLAKIISIELPEKERGFLSESAFQNELKLHPVGKVEIQLSFEIYGKIKAKKGLDQYPPVGAKVYACSSKILQEFLQDFGKEDECEDLLEIATLPNNENYSVNISANALFGRHCAIVGTTGGGKSYTISKIIEEILLKENSKVILIDGTGEFSGLGNDSNSDICKLGKEGNCYLDYTNLTESDFFALFRPSGQVQVPILQKAIKSLKLAKILEEKKDIEYFFYKEGFIEKSGNKKEEFNKKYTENISKIESDIADFKIDNLSVQIGNECIYEDALHDKSIFGGNNPGQRENSSSLIMRINAKISNSDLSQSFGLNNDSKKNKKSFDTCFNRFYEDKNKKLLKIDISEISFEENLREIVVNSIGRYFLEYSQKKYYKFKSLPVILFLDEAHQVFKTEKIKDEYSNEFKLDAFDRIAKECRKFGLFLCLSTQRPRDIPTGVLSQMGSFIVHRLINKADKDAIENSSPEGSKYILSFLPSLGQGEAILMGVDFPTPVNLKIKKVSDENKPNSDTPKLFKN